MTKDFLFFDLTSQVVTEEPDLTPLLVDDERRATNSGTFEIEGERLNLTLMTSLPVVCGGFSIFVAGADTASDVDNRSPLSIIVQPFIDSDKTLIVFNIQLYIILNKMFLLLYFAK